MDKSELNAMREERKNASEAQKPVNADSSAVLSAFVILIISLGFQLLHWFAYDKLEFDMPLLFFTPLILCLFYFLVYAETGRGHTLSTRTLFVFSCVVPFVLGLLVSGTVFLAKPNLSVFTGSTNDEESRLAVLVAVYSLRVVLTSLYLFVFAAVLSFCKKPKKRMSE